MQSVVRTVYGAYTQTCQLLGLPVAIKAHTTLNEKFDIHPEMTLESTDVPRMKYVCIGNGGHRTTIGTDGIAKIEVLQHMARNAALFNHLPFVLRTEDNDLNSTARAKYRLRKRITHDGTTYIAYYMKALDLTAIISQMDHITVADGIKTVTAFVPTVGDLNPNPSGLEPQGVNVVTGDYVFCSAAVPFKLTADEVTELLNVASILYGDENYAMISEIALCSGVDKAAIGYLGATSFSYTECIAAQVVNFISTFYSMPYSNDGIDMLLNVGSIESLLNLTEL